MIGQPKIDKHIPLPTARSWRGGRAFNMRGLLRTLEVGDSFVVPAVKGVTSQLSQRRALSIAQSLKPQRFTCRVVIENGKHVVRVWRTK